MNTEIVRTAVVFAAVLLWSAVAAAVLFTSLRPRLRRMMETARKTPFRAVLSALVVGIAVAYAGTKPDPDPIISTVVEAKEYAVTNGVFEGEVEFPAVFKGSLVFNDPDPVLTLTGDFPENFKTDYSAGTRLQKEKLADNKYKFTLVFDMSDRAFTGTKSYAIYIGYDTAEVIHHVDFAHGWMYSYLGTIVTNETRVYKVGFPYVTYPRTQLPTVYKRFSNSEFAGWYTGEHGTGVKISETNIVDSVYTNLYAWFKYDYKIAFHSNFEPDEIEMQTATSDKALNLVDVPFTRSRWKFNGWAATPDGEVVYTNRQEVINLVNYPGTNDLYAVWSTNWYTVVYHSGGGNGVMASQDIGLGEPTALTANAFSRLGYEFLGWDTDAAAATNRFADCAIVSNLCSMVGATQTLYAVWRLDTESTNTVVSGETSGTATIPVNPHGKAWAGKPLRVSLDPTSGSRCGVSLTVLSNGVNVAGTTDLATNALYVTFAAGSEYQLVLDARKAGRNYPYTIGIDLPGMEVIYDVAKGSALTPSNFNFSVGAPIGYFPSVTRGDGTNCVFVGWRDRQGKLCSDEEIVRVGYSELLTAVWSMSNFVYTVEFDGKGSNGGTMTNVFYRYGVQYTLPTNAFRRTGYAFSSWSNTVLGVRYENKATVSDLTEVEHPEVVLAAQWSPITYTVRYNASTGCRGEMADQSVEYDTSVELHPNAFIRPGYEFLGWDVNQSAGTVRWKDCAQISNLCSVAGAVYNLYPVWRQLPGVTTYSGSTNYNNVALSPDMAAIFVYRTNFTARVTSSGKYRLSLDPLEYDRCGAELKVEIVSNATAETRVTITDLETEAYEFEFEKNKVYRFSLTGSGTNDSYVVGIGLEGVQVNYRGLSGTIADSDHTYNFTVGIQYGYSPAFTAQPENDSFVGWYDGSFWPHANKVEKNSLVQATRPDLYAGWASYETAAAGTLILDCNDAECGNALVTTNEFAVGFVINDLLPYPTCSNHCFIGWLDAAAGDWWTRSSRLSTNAVEVTLQAQWESEWLLEENGSDGWTVTGYRGGMKGDILLPEMIGPRRVLAIGDEAFKDEKKLTGFTFRVTVPDEEDEDSGFDFLEEEITLGAAAFSGCTALKSFELPLGVRTLSDSLFAGCSSLTNSLDGIPYTVTGLGNGVFSNCTSLTGMTIPEAVTTLGDNVFRDCSKLKIVRYLGDAPSSVGDNIYLYTQSDLITAYLSVRNWNATAQDWALSYSRQVLPLNSTHYPVKKVTLNYNDGKTASATYFYIVGRVLGQLIDIEDSGDDGNLVGWYTGRTDGTAAKRYHVVSEAKTYYAHWSDMSAQGEVGFGGDFYGEDAENNGDYAYAAATYDGFLLNGEVLGGSFTLKAAKGKVVKGSGGTESNATFTVTIQVFGQKKLALSGTIDANGHAHAENAAKGCSFDADLTQFGLTNAEFESNDSSLTGKGARNRYAAKSSEAVALVSSASKLSTGAWTVAAYSAELGGWSMLSVSVGNKGKTKVSGTLANGTTVSATSTAIVGDGCCGIPIGYSKKNVTFAFVLWFTWSDEGEVIATMEAVNGFDEGLFSRVPSGINGELNLSVDGSFEIGDFVVEVEDPSETTITATGTKWKLPKADTWKFVRDEGWVQKKDNGNSTGLKLTYTAKTGLFKGSYTVYGTTDNGRSKKYKVSVAGGVVVNGDGEIVGYGSATIKKCGTLSVSIK